MIKKYIIKKNEKKIITISESGDYLIDLKEEGAEAEIIGMFLGKNEEIFDITTTQLHSAPRTKSRLIIKSALFGKSQLKFKGLIKIEKEAGGSEAYLVQKNLLFDHAEAESHPFLEIYNNNVSCKHGVTIGYVDNSQLSYLRSRGLTQKEVEKALVEAFLNE